MKAGGPRAHMSPAAADGGPRWFGGQSTDSRRPAFDFTSAGAAEACALRSTCDLSELRPREFGRTKILRRLWQAACVSLVVLRQSEPTRAEILRRGREATPRNNPPSWPARPPSGWMD